MLKTILFLTQICNLVSSIIFYNKNNKLSICKTLAVVPDDEESNLNFLLKQYI